MTAARLANNSRACVLDRPDYRKLGVLKQQFPSVPIIALTATATERVCADLQDILRIQGCETFRSSVNRPNLFYEVPCLPLKVAGSVLGDGTHCSKGGWSQGVLRTETHGPETAP